MQNCFSPLTLKRSSAWAVVSPFCTNAQNTVLYKLLMWPETQKHRLAYIFNSLKKHRQVKVKYEICTSEEPLTVLTICLPPAEIVSEVAVARIQDHTPIKTWGVQEGLVPKKVLPIIHIRGGELGDHMGH